MAGVDRPPSVAARLASSLILSLREADGQVTTPPRKAFPIIILVDRRCRDHHQTPILPFNQDAPALFVGSIIFARGRLATEDLGNFNGCGFVHGVLAFIGANVVGWGHGKVASNLDRSEAATPA